ncbi:hypothetical protein HSR121_2801 [Halapricum desulfuricans]|uniref:Uncharacterized protein n=1 Tax=Halapricum desulfuricans TaxID=2841257 RepID=A0A897N3Q6_9EURY|nr:hypothetical protein HSR121_2801 [Halapricum desulfuricans]
MNAHTIPSACPLLKAPPNWWGHLLRSGPATASADCQRFSSTGATPEP